MHERDLGSSRAPFLILALLLIALSILQVLTAGGPAATRPNPTAPEAVSGAVNASLQAMPPPSSPLPPGS